MPTIVAYVSGHGYGHAVRTAEVLGALAARLPDLRVELRSTVPASFFELPCPVRSARVALDVGIVQQDGLTLDLEATLRACERLRAEAPEKIEAELRDLRGREPSLVFSDIPALAFDVAERLAVPGVGMTNFSWDWIYADYSSDLPAFAAVAEFFRDSYAKATLLLRLPFHGDLSAFPSVRDISLVARRSSLDRGEARRRLGIPESAKVVLLSFGAYGVDLECEPEAPPGVVFLAPTSSRRLPASGVRAVDLRESRRLGLGHPELVAASDAVMTKPGYGIVAECLAHGVGVVYTSRGRFAEYDILVSAIERHLPSAFLSNEELREGRWRRALDEVLSSHGPVSVVPADGAAEAAEVLANFLR